MRVLDKLALLAQPLSNFFSPDPDAATCKLLRTLPEPLKSLQGECVSTSDCSGYTSPGFCQGAADIQVRFATLVFLKQS
jgi:hypothetical protein